MQNAHKKGVFNNNPIVVLDNASIHRAAVKKIDEQFLAIKMMFLAIKIDHLI